MLDLLLLPDTFEYPDTLKLCKGAYAFISIF